MERQTELCDWENKKGWQSGNWAVLTTKMAGCLAGRLDEWLAYWLAVRPEGDQTDASALGACTYKS